MSDAPVHSTYAIASTWRLSDREGIVTNGRDFAPAMSGAPAFDGKEKPVNPEELLLAAVEACFIQTWGIFVGKLKLPLEDLALTGTCDVQADPAGGFRVTRMTLAPKVPAALWADRRADVEKTLALAEKYCIVSKAVKTGLELRVEPVVV